MNSFFTIVFWSILGLMLGLIGGNTVGYSFHKDKLTDSTQAHQAASKHITDLQRKLTGSEKQRESVNTKLEDLANRFSNLASQSRQNAKSLAAAQRKNKDLQRQMTAAIKRLKEAQEQIKTFDPDCPKKNQILQMQVASLVDANETVQREVFRLKRETIKLKKQTLGLDR